MKIALIYVGIGVAGFNGNRPPGDREGSWIGHGVASIGASLKAAGYEANLIDMRRLGGWEQFKERIKQEQADVYGLSVSAVDHYSALQAAAVIKSVYSKSKVIVGGIHPSILPNNYNHADIDTVVVGEGEITFIDLIRDIEAGIELPKKTQGKKPDLDIIPWVDRELFDYKKELECVQAPDQKTPSVTMLAGRGCPFHCTYCQNAENVVFGSPYRIRSPENVMAELRFLKDKYNFKSITFWDDTFTLHRGWVLKFCDLFEKEHFDATITACSRADIICQNEEMVERLAGIGLDWFVIGLESGSQRILDFIQKGTTVEQNLESAKICRKYKIKIFGTYMYGLPTETKEEALATAQMIDEIQPEHGSPFYFFPIQGTKIYDYCIEHDLILDDVKNRTIARTGVFFPTLKDIDYDYLGMIRSGYRGKSMMDYYKQFLGQDFFQRDLPQR